GAENAIAQQLAHHGSPDAHLPRIATRLSANVQAWLNQLTELAGASDREWQFTPLDELSAWCERSAQPFGRVVDAAEHVSGLSGCPVTLDFTKTLLRLAAEKKQRLDTVQNGYADSTELLGTHFCGVETDWGRIRGALQWTEQVREKLGDRVHEHIADAILFTSLRSD